MKADIVLGLGWGDEGKGITTDYLCRQNPLGSIVVRFSGGHQCGHTVMDNGIKHVHSNFGSGTLRGIPTYISEYCTIYLNTMMVEKAVLEEKGIEIKRMAVHPLAKITTPYDVAWNRINNKTLNDGSCGLGIGATMNRNITSGYKLFAIDLMNKAIFKQKLNQIRLYYVNLIDSISHSFSEKNEMLNAFNEIVYKELRFFMLALEKLPFKILDYSVLRGFNQIIFEGSQGILLDMDHGIFPNVTYANTTSKNALEICKKIQDCRIIPHIYYVTRCYQTRHGNGWMSSENSPIELINNKEEINVHNEFQGSFRIRELDYDLLNYAIYVDKIYSSNLATNNLVVTCLDQREGFKFENKKLNTYFDKILASHSPDSKDFQIFK